MVKEIPLEIEIKLLDQFIIGSGNPSVKGADIALSYYLDHRGRRLLPTSTFKGILRKACNRVVKLVDSNWKPCYEIEPGRIKSMCIGSGYEWLESFGIPGYTEHIWNSLIFDELEIRSPHEIYTYTHTSISLSTQTVKPGALYTVEYLPPYTCLKAKLRLLVKERDNEKIGLDKSKVIKYLKLILLAIMESPVIGIGRNSKPFEIKIVNTKEIKAEIEKIGLKLDKDIEDLLNVLSKPYSPFINSRG
ncbi:MAG: hypothetical protein DRO40_03890 [Thermoprotei archaeon]|nr:MAG: hypothetical protein DRO40_03890 [Thermoprotei archaeon]